MLVSSSLSLGRRTVIEYPARNLFGVPLEFVRRNIEIHAILDARRRPVPVEKFLLRPFVRRGSTLIYATDLDIGERRKYWAEAAAGHQKLPGYRLGLYDPARPCEAVDWVGRVFAPTSYDRFAMKAAIEWFQQLVKERGPIGLRLAAFPVEG